MENIALLQVKNISKVFVGVKVLSDVSIDFFPGEVHALCGENGAGKSTLIKIISGVHQPTEGYIVYKGNKVGFDSPKQALKNGISVIHQELSVAKDITVAENVFMGVEPRIRNSKIGLLDRKKMNRLTDEVLGVMGIPNIKSTDIVGNLSAAHQQMVEIAKVITKKSSLIVMDEPTSSLSDGEIKVLFKQIDILKKNNVAIIYITHRLKELNIICDRVSILKDGVLVKTMLMKDTNESDIVSNMVGRTITDYYNKKEHHRLEEVLRVEGFSKKGVFKNINFSAYKGEILGIVGLVGAKRTDVLECIFGASNSDTGKVFVYGNEVKFRSPRDAISSNIGFVTEDRRTTGLMLEASLRDNAVLPSILQKCKKLLLRLVDNRWEKNTTLEYMKKLKVKAVSMDSIISTLSGGNQQKVILAKWLIAESSILLLDEPTRGIDVNAKSEFYGLMNDFVANGGSIIMVSSELPEVLGISDRIIVMRDGVIRGELSKEEASEQSIIDLASFHRE